jgi:2-(3-amino-3-carboxypropyl)histidine synthase
MERNEIVSSYDLELDKVVQEVKARKSKRIVLQFPDGLIEYASKIARQISAETSSETIVSLDTCYGACDLATNAASRLGADIIIHYGHARWQGKHGIPTIYVEASNSLDLSSILPSVKDLLSGSERIGLVSTVQHIQKLDEVRKYLEKNGFTVVIGKATGRVPHNGQVLGCDYSTAKSISSSVDRFVIIGGGKFHAVGLSLATRKDCITIDPFTREVATMGEMLRHYLKSRYACMMEAKTGRIFGVVIGLKSGQLDMAGAFKIRDKLEKSGKNVVLFCADNLTPDRLNSIKNIDAFVIAACPRIAIDDAALFKKPVLTIDEAEIILSDKLLEAYLALD